VRRFFVEHIDRDARSCIIRGTEARHLAKVLRMAAGDRCVVMDRAGNRFQARIESAAHKEVRVMLERPLPAPPPSPVEITLCQALLKSRPMDYVIQKTSEIGVHSIIPFLSHRTVVRVEETRVSGKLRHWREVARDAATQSDRASPAQLESPAAFTSLMARWRHVEALKVLLWEQEDSQDLKGLLRQSPAAKRFIALIGPEGGFERSEVESARAAGFTAVSLGSRILRAETAAVTIVAIVQYEWGDLGLLTPERRT